MLLPYSQILCLITKSQQEKTSSRFIYGANQGVGEPRKSLSFHGKSKSFSKKRTQVQGRQLFLTRVLEYLFIHLIFQLPPLIFHHLRPPRCKQMRSKQNAQYAQRDVFYGFVEFSKLQQREILIAFQLSFLHVIKTMITKLFGTREHLLGQKTSHIICVNG